MIRPIDSNAMIISWSMLVVKFDALAVFIFRIDYKTSPNRILKNFLWLYGFIRIIQ